jgi:predicted phosphodiesterase
MPNHKNPHASELADEYVKKHPDMPSLTLARLMAKKHPRVWKDVDAARCAIRYRRGANGKAKREDRGLAAITTPASKFNPINPLNLPASFEREHTPFIMDGCERVLVLPDIHLPYHNIGALTLALQTGQRRKVDGILINGDLADFHTLSRFCKNPEARSFKQERKTALAFLSKLRELFPDARIVFKEGNHDERLQHYIMERAPELYDVTINGLGALFNLKKFGIEHVYEKREVMVGKLPVLHGHELPRGISAPVNPARGAFMRAKVSCMVSHSHKTSEHTETNLGRDIVTCWSTGCLCELRPLYEPNNGWNHGFAEIEVSTGGLFNVTNFRIHNGKLLNS